jgi:6-phosphogluconolactonase
VNITSDDEILSEKVGYRLEEIVLQLMKTQQIITIGLSGGSLIDTLASIVPRLQFPWARLRFFFVDERFVPFTSEESTYGNYQTKLFRQLPITEKNIIKINPNLKSVEECAQDYQIKLQDLLTEENKVRRFNLLENKSHFLFFFSHLILFYLEWDLMDIQQVFFLIIQF